MLSECPSQSQKLRSARLHDCEVTNAVTCRPSGAWQGPEAGQRGTQGGNMPDEDLATRTLNYILENGYNVNSMLLVFVIVFKMPGLPEDTGSET